MLELNRNAEVAIHGQAADIEWTLQYNWQESGWTMTIEALVDLPDKKETKKYNLTDAQASATLALFIGELDNPQLNQMLYDIAEDVWRDVEQHFRPIP